MLRTTIEIYLTHRLSLRLQRDEPAFLPLVGPSRPMRELSQQIDALATGSASVLLVGENGTGKGYLAEYIHSRSERASRPFAELNCAASNPDTLAAELFGTIGEQSSGLLSTVQGGTILIDDVAELPYELQLRLLDVLGDEPAHASAGSAHGDVAPRLIAASCKDLVNEVNAGRFHEALYYRLSVAPVHLPPLRARSREDLSELITATFSVLSMNMSNSPRALGEDLIDCLIAYPWPGNIRELRNALERALLVARGETMLQRQHLPAELHDVQGSDVLYTPRTLMDVERAHIHRTLRAHKLNRTHAARELGISRATLIKKIKEYGLVYRGQGRT